jgi:two-component system, LytTR family, response regulator
MSSLMRVLVVDDDPKSRERIRVLLSAQPDVEVIDECEDGSAAVDAIRARRPDIVFLDVQMPKLDGFEVVSMVGPANMPVTVFASAHVDFALRAFEAYALDYLLKPFDDERFASAFKRARGAVEARRGVADPRIEALVRYLDGATKEKFPALIAVKVGDQYRFVGVEEIDYLEADGNYLKIHSGKSVWTIHRSLTDLEARVLDPDRFVRIHRSSIINIARVAYVEALFHGDLSVVMKDGSRLVCTRRYRARLQERVHFTS